MSALAFQRCEDCGAAIHYARVVCPSCGSTRLEEVAGAGRGVVYSTTTVHRREGRHNVVLVDLQEGFRVMGTVVGLDPDDVRIDMKVTARHEGEGDDARVVFERA